MKDPLTEIADEIFEFTKERDWDQFHTVKNLATALSIEASELLEIYQWSTKNELSRAELTPDVLARTESEIADIAIYLFLLVRKIDGNLPTIIKNKLKLNSKKYPADKCRGSSKKYTELPK